MKRTVLFNYFVCRLLQSIFPSTIWSYILCVFIPCILNLTKNKCSLQTRNIKDKCSEASHPTSRVILQSDRSSECGGRMWSHLGNSRIACAPRVTSQANTQMKYPTVGREMKEEKWIYLRAALSARKEGRRQMWFC